MRFDRIRHSLFMLATLALLTIAVHDAHSEEGGDGWRKEFDSICAQTAEVESYSREELGKLVDRCDGLKPQIEQLDESERKVFLRRLQMCRELYRSVRDAKRERE